ncbi:MULTISPECIES: hypothetical protein [unclassified Alteromonas]|uniref:hypothetical protein n=1 Tax=unclassified Alteromonas TaxID=2614992 RepID=UPI0005096E64|nr:MULTISPECIES: hypothetical protein [unclassified Alteromonas]
MEEAKDVYDWYQFAKDFLPTFATLIVAFFSIRFAILQIKEQHQNALDLQVKQRKKDIQLTMFEEIQEKLDICSSISSQIHSNLILHYTYLENGAEPNYTDVNFVQDISAVTKSITDVTIYLEHREVISPKLFRVARSAMHSVHHDLLETLKNVQMDRVLRYRTASKSAADASSYCHDLNSCLQNNAFGDLFENQAPVRQPIDPNEKVIVDEANKLDELLQYFEHETSYGQQMDRTNQLVREEYGQD